MLKTTYGIFILLAEKEKDSILYIIMGKPCRTCLSSSRSHSWHCWQYRISMKMWNVFIGNLVPLQLSLSDMWHLSLQFLLVLCTLSDLRCSCYGWKLQDVKCNDSFVKLFVKHLNHQQISRVSGAWEWTRWYLQWKKKLLKKTVKKCMMKA